jgi:hypothetical protein
MKTAMKKLAALLLPLLGVLAVANLARATDVGLPLLPPGAPYLWAGDTFSLNNSAYDNGRTDGSQLAGSLVERSDIVAMSDRLLTNPVWTGSNTFVLSHDSGSPNDGYVARNPAVSGSDGGSLMYVPAKYYINADKPPRFPIVSTQAAVRVGSSDTVTIGLLDNVAEYSDVPISQQSFAGSSTEPAMGMIWMTLNDAGAYQVFYKDENDVTHSIDTIAGMLPDFNPNTWQALYLAWDDRTNTIMATINGHEIIAPTAYSTDGSVPTIAGYGFQFAGTAALDNFSAVPEPSSVALMAMGVFGVGAIAWRKRVRKAAAADCPKSAQSA